MAPSLHSFSFILSSPLVYWAPTDLRSSSFNVIYFSLFVLRKTRDLFKKIRDTTGPKMGTVKDRNGMDLTEAGDIKKRWHEYTELYKKKSS